MKICFFVLMLGFLLWARPVVGKPVVIDKVASKNPRLFVLTIGVNDFADDFFPDLRWAERDAERLASGIGTGTGFEIIRKTLKGAAVTKDAVEAELRRIAVRATGRDVLLLYASTHGSLMVGADGDLKPVLVLPATDSKALATTSLPMTTIMQWVERIPARRKFVMSAACHSGVGKSRLTPEMQERLAQNKGIVDLSLVSEGTVLLSAAARNEVAVEDNKLKSDLYTHYFLGALDVFDRNQDGAVSVLEAHDYATEMAFKASGGRQRPTIQAEVVGDIDIPLRGKRTTKGLPILTGYSQQLSGVEIEVNQQPKGKLPLAFPLQVGKNQVSLFAQDGGEKIGTFTLRMRDGEELSIDELLAGHPFAAGFYAGSLQPVQGRFAKLTDGSLFMTGFLGTYRQGRIELGLDLRMPVRAEVQVVPGLDAKLTQYSLSLKPGLRFATFGSWSMNGDLLLGYDSFALEFSDRETGFTIGKRSGALLTGAALSFNWTLLDLMILSAGGAYERAKHDFGSLGSLDASRRLVSLGIRFTFGGKARRR